LRNGRTEGSSSRSRAADLVNGAAFAAADYNNDGRVDVAVNSIGGKLVLPPERGSGRALARSAASRRSRRAPS